MEINELLEIIKYDESEILEFKIGNQDPERIGKYISGLSNSAALLSKQQAYIIWGISDDKKLVGTNFFPQSSKKGNEPLISWLERGLDPRIMIRFEEIDFENKHFVVLVIQMSARRPVEFYGQRYIRSGSSLKKLEDFPEKEQELWRSFDAVSFEREFASTNCTLEEVFLLLDIPTYLQMMDYEGNSSDEMVRNYLLNDLIIQKSGEVFNITNLGAFAFARRLDSFEKLSSHAVRVIRYKGKNKREALADMTAGKGAAIGFFGLLEFIRTHLPVSGEVTLSDGRKLPKTDYPELVIREVVANQLVHQDFSVQGSNPMIEIYDNRIEITNPGAPINEALRLIDMPPISRNNELADLFKKMHLVEQRGSGLDNVIIELEMNNLPAPRFEAKGDYMVVTLFEQKDLKDMQDSERDNVLYWHSVIKSIEDEKMTNKSVRERFNLSSKQASLASRAIAHATKSGLIKAFDENAGNKFMQYIPFWMKSFNEQ
ncbi:MAG: putative DNA binding domain-containing protein [Streptococcaceae bacterium]|jgi:predicted HTH transcriptional regulator|nr:putative DNA binding domain-containing protein [Streptococcaceae bacterium]